MPRGRHLLSLLALTACVPELPGRQNKRDDSPTAAPRSAALLRETMLARHARERAAVGVPPLVWDAGLAAQALDYARSMAVTGRFARSEQPERRGREGENLWAGARGVYTYDQMLDGWAAEKRLFVNLAAPGFSRTGRWADVAHYTQMVWRGTTRVGCGLASDHGRDFLVCRYLMPGNVAGRRAY
ncbi:CAP domain-containing protein [Sphingomonas sp.]|uniref:CAP domain-containing protein n=1 Tax=Sphingomonas sp. TaxID=28214 RepID=UPI003B00930F